VRSSHYARAAVSQSTSDDLKLFPDRRSRYVFLARALTLVITSGVLAIYGLSQLARPAGTPVTAATPMPPAIASQSVLPVTATVASGILAEDVEVISQDGLALLSLPMGTTVLDANGQPPVSITVTAKELPSRWDIALVGLAYEFGPNGTTLDPPASLTLRYDPKAYWPFSFQDVDCSQLHTAWVSSTGAPAVPWLEVSVDLNGHSVTTKIDHFGTLMLFCEVQGLPIS
jgi:hypothetical protein